MAGYHLQPIKKGKLGFVSKIQEELDEINDSIKQDVRIMVMVELSDLIGAVKLVAEKQGFNFKDILYSKLSPIPGSLDSLQTAINEAQAAEDNQDKTILLQKLKEIVIITEEFALFYDCHLQDLVAMQTVTERAFTSGSRKSNE